MSLVHRLAVVRSVAYVGLTLVGAILGASIAIRWGSEVSIPVDTTDVATDWNTTIARLGIEPIYPPQEDFQVGDVFASIVDMNDQTQPLAGRAIKIFHVDMRADLEKSYSELSAFPETLPRPSDPNAIWQQPHSTESIFGTTTQPHSLALMVFPGFSFGHIRQSRANGGAAKGLFGGVFGATAEGQDSVELRIPFAETYGVPSIIASGRLTMFCEDEPTKGACNERFAREHLSMVVGQDAFKPEVKVEVWLVNRVYLARSLEQVHSANSSVGIAARLITKLREKSAELATQSGASSGSDPSIQRNVENQRKQLESLIAEASNGSPGTSVAVQSINGSSVSVTQTLPRPVAIGFRAVRRSSQQQLEVSR